MHSIVRAHTVTPIRVLLAVLAVLAVLELSLPGKAVLGSDGAAVGLVLVAATLSWMWPRAGAGVAVLAGVVGYAAVSQALLAVSVAGLLGVVVLIRHRVPTVVVVAAVTVGVAATSWNRYAGVDSGSWLGELVVAAAVTAAVAGMTAARRSHAETARAEARVREQEIASQRRDATLAERARIGRELHDVVAHSVSVIAALAETAPFAVPDLPPAGRQRFADIATSARDALGELRDLLSVLRRDGPDAAGLGPEPVPDLRGIDGLLVEHRQAGRRVDIRTDGELAGVPIAVEIAAHRIVQEALTNVRRHTRDAHTTVTLTRTPDRLVVDIRDTGPRRPAHPEAGHGLLGMHERAAALTGSLHAKPDGDGFRVTAELPLPRGES